MTQWAKNMEIGVITIISLFIITADSNSIQLGRIMQCATGWPGTFYLGYGCYCGLGSRGTHPVDDIDR